MDRLHVVFSLLLLLHTSSEQDVAVLPTADKTPCPRELSVVIVNGHLLANRSLLSDTGIVYPHGQYWEEISAANNNVTVTHGCVCNIMRCIRKCCPENHVYSATFKGECVVKDHPLLQPFQVNVSAVDEHDDYAQFHVLYGDPCKIGKYKLEPDYDEFQLDGSGTLSVVPGDGSGGTNHSADGYCLELVLVNETGTITPFPCFGEQEEMAMDEKAMYLIYPIGMLISEPFLLATFLVYAIIPELRNIHGQCLMSHVTALFMAYLFLATVQLNQDGVSPAFCVTAAFIIHFSFLASFFWLNIMCFDLWWTFSGCRPMTGSMREREHKKFIIYSLYCWGSPLVISIITMVMDLSPNISEEFIKPGFGKSKCWFEDEAGQWAYFYGIVAVIISANIIMFVTTALKIIKLKKETKVLKGSESKRSGDDDDNSQRFGLYLKLFIVMGVNWAMEVISWAVGGPSYLWFITDIGNTLQGIFIFFIFVWKDKIRKLINKRFGDGSDKSSASQSGKSTRASSMRNTSVSQCDMSMSPVGRKNVSSVP